MTLQGKRIVLGISGGIAAYKSAVLLRLLQREGADVQVVMTPAAKEFITPLTLATLSRHPVASEFFDRRDGSWNSHVELGLWADLMLIAPATASTLAKMAHGVADNLLITTYLSMKAPVMVAPAMDLDMYAHPSTTSNLRTLKSYGVHILEPSSGFLASGLEGKGRMQEPEEILKSVISFWAQRKDSSSPLKGKKVVITAGPTHEMIDDVRFIANYSTGLMGISLANSFAEQGAEVHLCLGPTHLRANTSVQTHSVVSAQEMFDETAALFDSCDIAIFAAAVADFRPQKRHEGKLKRQGTNELSQILLEKNPDIAAILGRRKKNGQYLVGFALETTVDISEARRKLTDKNLDAIVLNSLSEPGAGFAVPTNKICIIDTNSETSYPLASKREVANQIVAHVIKNLQ